MTDRLAALGRGGSRTRVWRAAVALAFASGLTLYVSVIAPEAVIAPEVRADIAQ